MAIRRIRNVTIEEARSEGELLRAELEQADREDAPFLALQRAEAQLDEAGIISRHEGDELAGIEIQDDGVTLLLRRGGAHTDPSPGPGSRTAALNVAWFRPLARRLAGNTDTDVAVFHDRTLRAAASLVPLEFDTPAGTRRLEFELMNSGLVLRSSDDFSFVTELAILLVLDGDPQQPLGVQPSKLPMGVVLPLTAEVLSQTKLMAIKLGQILT
jgi:hypothetical protein